MCIDNLSFPDRLVNLLCHSSATLSRAKELASALKKSEFSCLQTAITEGLSRLSDDDRHQLKITAADWNATGPNAEVKSRCVEVPTWSNGRLTDWHDQGCGKVSQTAAARPA